VLEPLVYTSIMTPLHELFLAASETGLSRIRWETSGLAFETELAGEWDRPAERVDRESSSVLAQACRQLEAYFGGRRRGFDVPLDLTRLRPFQRQILTALRQVPFGETISYGELAELAGYRGAARAVGGAMRGNPLPIIIPCHRVVLSSGALGGFGGRPELKRQLLAIEGWGNDD
jgi:methylated-DNA-[protein]-cysteine S-methyltransferase